MKFFELRKNVNIIEMFEEPLIQDGKNHLVKIGEKRTEFQTQFFDLPRRWAEKNNDRAPLEVGFRACDLFDRFLRAYQGDLLQLDLDAICWAIFLIASKMTRACLIHLSDILAHAHVKDPKGPTSDPKFDNRVLDAELVVIHTLAGQLDYLCPYHYLSYLLDREEKVSQVNAIFQMMEFTCNSIKLNQAYSSFEITIGCWSLFADQKSTQLQTMPERIREIREYLFDRIEAYNKDGKHQIRITPFGINLEIPKFPRRILTEPLLLKMKDLQYLKVLGSGVTGDVDLYRSLTKPKNYAIKKYFCNPSVDYYKNYGVPVEFLREISVLLRNSSKHLIQVHGFEVNLQSKMIYEILEHGGHSIYDFVYDYNSAFHKNKAEMCRQIIRQILEGLEDLHQRGIFHRDIKPTNVVCRMIRYNRKVFPHVKLIDFGLAKRNTSELKTPRMVTLWYRPPEVCQGEEYNEKTDIWSLACMIFEMINVTPFCPTSIGKQENETHIINMKKMFSSYEGPAKQEEIGRLLSLKYRDKNLVDLLSKMLAWKPADRISAKEALLHPYFHEDRQETEDVRMTDVNSPAKIEIQVDSMKTIRKDLE